MGLILLVLIGFLPTYYALDLNHPTRAKEVREAAISIREVLSNEQPGPTTAAMLSDLDVIITSLEGKTSFGEVPPAEPAGQPGRQCIAFAGTSVGRGSSPAVHEDDSSAKRAVHESDRVRAHLGHVRRCARAWDSAR